MLNEHNTVFALNRSAICNRCFHGPIPVLNANGISIAAAVFAGLTTWQTDWQTDKPRYSVLNNRRSESGEAKFCYCLRLQQVFTGVVDSTDRINFIIAIQPFRGCQRNARKNITVTVWVSVSVTVRVSLVWLVSSNSFGGVKCRHLPATVVSPCLRHYWNDGRVYCPPVDDTRRLCPPYEM